MPLVSLSSGSLLKVALPSLNLAAACCFKVDAKPEAVEASRFVLSEQTAAALRLQREERGRREMKDDICKMQRQKKQRGIVLGHLTAKDPS